MKIEQNLVEAKRKIKTKDSVIFITCVRNFHQELFLKNSSHPKKRICLYLFNWGIIHWLIDCDILHLDITLWIGATSFSRIKISQMQFCHHHFLQKKVLLTLTHTSQFLGKMNLGKCFQENDILPISVKTCLQKIHYALYTMEKKPVMIKAYCQTIYIFRECFCVNNLTPWESISLTVSQSFLSQPL